MSGFGLPFRYSSEDRQDSRRLERSFLVCFSHLLAGAEARYCLFGS